MKVDKDTLLKQKFWLLLGVFALLWLICLSALYANGGGPIGEAMDKYKKANDSVKRFTGANRPKNNSFLPPWQADIERFEQHKNTVWKTAWDGDKEDDALPPGQKRWEGQKKMYTWPSSADFNLQAELLYPDRMKADGSGPAFDVNRRDWYKKDEAYGRQFEQLKADLKGDGDKSDLDKPFRAVDFRGGFDAVMQPIDWSQGGKVQRAPDIEECWLAQEDFWVKRELLYTVRDALAMAANLDPVDAAAEKIAPPAGAPEGTPRQVFRNSSWEVQLLFDKGANGLRISPASTIKNIHVSHRDQDLGSAKNPDGVRFRLIQDGQPVRTLSLIGEKVAWQQSRDFGSSGAKDGFSLATGDPARPMALEQIFDPTNVPVVAVDEIKIPYLSNRNANRPLIPTKPDRYGKHDASAADAAKTPAPGAPGAPGAVPGGSTLPGGMMGGVPGQPGAADKAANKTANGFFDRNRYLFVTEQSRHLPLAMTLTIDQSHLGEILVAAANSRLRFQTTQVEFRRVHGPRQNGSSTPAGGFSPPGMSGIPPTGSGPASGRPPLPGTGPGAPAATAVDEDNPNLIEVTLYGIASLYERPPGQ